MRQLAAAQQDSGREGQTTGTIQGVVFDVIGTLARFVPEQEALLSQAAAIHGLLLPPTAARRGLAAGGAWWQQQMALGPLERRSETERHDLYQGFDAAVMTAAGFDLEPRVTSAIFATLLELGNSSHLEVYDDVAPALEALKAAGYPLGVISNMDATLQVTLESLDLAGYFGLVLSSQEAGFAKPDPRIFLLAAERMGIAAAALAYVGDQPEIDVRGALSAGLQPVLVDREQAFPETQDCWRIATLTELPHLLRAARNA